MPAFSRPSTGLSAIAIPASKMTPSNTRASVSLVASATPNPRAPGPPANSISSPVAPFSRSCSACALACRGVRMIDPLHDLPGRGGGRGLRSVRRRGRADRSGRSSGRHRSCRPASRTARPSARHRPACASRHRSPARNPRPAAARQLKMSFGRALPSSRSIVGRKLPRADRQAKRLFWELQGRFSVSPGRATAQFPGSIAAPARP